MKPLKPLTPEQTEALHKSNVVICIINHDFDHNWDEIPSIQFAREHDKPVAAFVHTGWSGSLPDDLPYNWTIVPWSNKEELARIFKRFMDEIYEKTDANQITFSGSMNQTFVRKKQPTKGVNRVVDFLE